MKGREKQHYLRMLPSVDRILQQERVEKLLDEYPRWLVLKTVQIVVDEERKNILGSAPASLSDDHFNLDFFSRKVSEKISDVGQFSLKKVINATGVIVHTNLGRSLLNDAVLRNIVDIASSFSNLEYDLRKGERGSRYSHVEEILCELTGAEAALVVNNNAGAVLLALSTIANGRKVIVSRGQLVEIGGSFRIPDVMRNSGAELVEVGTTNKTHLRDYREAISDNTALLLKVHTSNFQVVGFTSEVALEELVQLGHEHAIPVMEDLGSGCLIDLSKFGLSNEPTVQDAIKTGADVVTFSGDKLLGGPQGGIILGSEEVVGKIKKNPLTRALRIDKLTLAALESTLRIYMEGDEAVKNIPTLQMLTLPPEEIDRRAKSLYRRLKKVDSGNLDLEICNDSSRVGGGALPLQDLPTRVVAFRSEGRSVEDLEEGLRRYNPPIIARIDNDRIVLDVRTLQKGDPSIIEKAIRDLLAED